MVATLTLKRINEIHQQKSLPTVATGPVSFELSNIEYARLAFRRGQSYRSLITAFLSVNSMSLVDWPVGLHEDFFAAGCESLENKLLFIYNNKNNNNNIGRGGSLIGRQRVAAILDWVRPTRPARMYYLNHRHEMTGIDQNITTNTQRRLTDWFETAGDIGALHQQQYEMYLAAGPYQGNAGGGGGGGGEEDEVVSMDEHIVMRII